MTWKPFPVIDNPVLFYYNLIGDRNYYTFIVFIYMMIKMAGCSHNGKKD